MLYIHPPYELTALAVVVLPLPPPLRGDHGQGSLQPVTGVEDKRSGLDGGNVLLCLLYTEPQGSAQNVVLNSNAVDEVAPDEGVGESVEQILDGQHRGALG